MARRSGSWNGRRGNHEPEPEPLRETRKQATERRIAALEAHITDLEERLRPLFGSMPEGYRWPTAAELAEMSDADLIDGKLIKVNM